MSKSLLKQFKKTIPLAYRSEKLKAQSEMKRSCKSCLPFSVRLLYNFESARWVLRTVCFNSPLSLQWPTSVGLSSKLKNGDLNFRLVSVFCFGRSLNCSCLALSVWMMPLTSVHKVKHLPNCVWELGNKMECTEIILYKGNRTGTSPYLNL